MRIHIVVHTTQQYCLLYCSLLTQAVLLTAASITTSHYNNFRTFMRTILIINTLTTSPVEALSR